MGSDTEDDDAARRSARLSSVPLFKGVKSSYPDWARRFVATCEQRNCVDAPEIDALTNLPSDPKEEAKDDVVKKKNEIALKQNKMAMALLNTALVGDAMGVFITKTYSTLYPHGIACLVWKGLKKRYQPDGINLTLDFNKELQEVSMARHSAQGIPPWDCECLMTLLLPVLSLSLR
jgi:hypothetical protein